MMVVLPRIKSPEGHKSGRAVLQMAADRFDAALEGPEMKVQRIQTIH